VLEGRERYTVNLRLPRELRGDPESIAHHVRIDMADGASVPLGDVAEIRLTTGPSTIRTENAQLAAYLYVDTRDSDIGGYVEKAKKAVAEKVSFPSGYYVVWSGQFEYLQRAKARLQIVIPFTLGIIFLLLYMNFGRLTETFIVMLSLPFSLVGGLWLMWWLNFNFSVAVAVGFIALAGVAAETGVVMIIYLQNALSEWRQRAETEGRPFTASDLRSAIMEGAVERVRPKVMTVAAIMAGLLPILWSTGTGSEVMQRIAVPMIGGMVSSTILTLVVIPAIFALVNGRSAGTERTSSSLPFRALPARED
jgi:Cu(I)/Ag(I) efflux system membrane protein CusA/SilA